MQTFSVSVDLSELLQAAEITKAGIFQNLSAAVERVAMAGAERWREEVLRAPLWDGERQAYADSIQVIHTGEFSADIVSTYRYVEDIENGRPSYDMKKMLDSSMKVRISKKGRRYLIIPMRHNTPGNSAGAPEMPTNIYAQARSLTPSKITGQGTRESGTGAYDIHTRQKYLVRKNSYKWGGRLPRGLAPKLKPHHKTDPYAGIVRFDAKTPGGKNYSSYITFRVMAEGQAGWVLPAKPGLFIARNVADRLMTDAKTVFSAAVAADLAA